MLGETRMKAGKLYEGQPLASRPSEFSHPGWWGCMWGRDRNTEELQRGMPVSDQN
jgi:hypothetical protein